MQKNPAVLPRVLLAFCLLVPCGFSSAAKDTIEAWKELESLREREALAGFEQAGDDPLAKLGTAVALINLQPKTEANLDRAQAILEQLEDRPDLPGVLAGYFLARLPQVHRRQKQPDEAVRRYQKLLAEHPEHPFGQLALVQIALIKIRSAKEDADRASLLQELSASGRELTFPPAVRDFHLALADAYADWRISEKESLGHLLTAYESGAVTGNVLATLLVRIGEISRKQGDFAQARIFYQKFLDNFSQEIRAYAVRQRMEELP